LPDWPVWTVAACERGARRHWPRRCSAALATLAAAAASCLLVMLLALWYTHSKGAILALLVVALLWPLLLARAYG